jgi:hypothetical protein
MKFNRLNNDGGARFSKAGGMAALTAPALISVPFQTLGPPNASVIMLS